ncbi:hypothetical protein TWF788_004320 [Orbilia oligospora]|uniref:Uncharacterized protein n=1 Tax=Orbilia oligospora TaxID=2813651 RepID=A0A7C8UB91_ORBOL|nr:hypothetical protein TWF788_004320 [Orbilia oligospora]
MQPPIGSKNGEVFDFRPCLCIRLLYPHTEESLARIAENSHSGSETEEEEEEESEVTESEVTESEIETPGKPRPPPTQPRDPEPETPKSKMGFVINWICSVPFVFTQRFFLLNAFHTVKIPASAVEYISGAFVPLLTSIFLLYFFPELKHVIISYIASLFFRSAEALASTTTNALTNTSSVTSTIIARAANNLANKSSGILDNEFFIAFAVCGFLFFSVVLVFFNPESWRQPAAPRVFLFGL